MASEDWKAQLRARIQEDGEQISRELFNGTPLGPLLSLRSVEQREDEFRPWIVDCEAGRFLYKPRDLRFEDALGKLACSLFPGELTTPRYALGSDYGYAEFLQFETMPLITDKPNLLSYRTGKLHALFHALGRMDIGGDNIGAWNNKPVLLDAELCLDPKQYPMDHLQARLELLAQEDECLRELLDSPFRGAAGLYALGQMPPSLIEKVLPCKAAAASTASRLAAAKADAATRAGAEASTGADLPPGFKSYLRGYEEGWDICLERKEQLEDFVKGCGSWSIRVILPCGSPLQMHVAMLAADVAEEGSSFSPGIDPAIIEELKGNAALYAQQGKGAIYRAQADGRSLYDVRAGRAYPEFFEKSAVDNTLLHLQRAHEDQARFIAAFLRRLLLHTP